jgi:hypothetical protein
MNTISKHSANYEARWLDMLQLQAAAHEEPIMIVMVYPDAINVLSSKHSSGPTRDISPVNRFGFGRQTNHVIKRGLLGTMTSH